MRWKAATLVFSVFLAGALVGGLSVRVLGDRIFATGASSAGTRPTKASFLKQLDQTVALTPDQKKQISSIVDDIVAEHGRLYASITPQFEEARQRGRQRIRAVLTPEQLPKFEAYLNQLDEQRKREEADEKK